MHRPAKPNPSDDLSGASRSRRRIRGRVRQIVAGLGASLLLVLMPLPVQSGMAAEAVAQSPGSAAAEVPEGSADQLLREGMALLRSGDFPAAAQKLRQVLDRDAAHIEAHIQLGNVLRRMQLYDGARAEYERALELGGGRADLYQNLGVVEARSNRFRASALNFEKAIELAPQRANLHHSLGKAYEEQARFDGALQAFEEALRLDPGDADSAAALANLLIMKGRSRRAIEILTKVLRESPDHAHACYQLGLAFLNEAQPGRAVEYLERAVQSNPALRGAWLNLGRAAESAGREALSREAFERFERLYNQERAQEVEKHHLAQRIEREVPVRHERAVRLSGEDRYEEAIRELEEILVLQPNDARTLLNVARLHEARGDEAQARQFLLRAAAADPGYADPQIDLARLDRAAGRTREALERTDRVLGLQPGNGPAWLLRGILLAEERSWSDAAGALEQASEHLPRSPEPYRWLAVVYRELDRAVDAERAQRLAGTLSPAGEEAPR